MISIHPEFAEAIIEGKKKVEFRKLNIPKHVQHVVMYVTAPECKIPGYFSIKRIVEGLASDLWNQFQDVSGTTEEFFFKYYGEEGTGRGLVVDKVDVLLNPMTIDQLGEESRPPQSFTYVGKDIWRRLQRRKKVSTITTIA